MASFEKIAENLYYLKIPFGPVFTSAILLTGKEPVLVDTGAKDDDVDDVLVPALSMLGLSPEDLRFVTLTHCHGDHLGGLHRFMERAGRHCTVALFERSAVKAADPVPYAIRIRTAFPEYSPAPQSFLKGVPCGLVLKEGEQIGGRLELIHTPGHDDDCIALLDHETGTLITGDSLQGNGTISQGVAFYQSLPDYLETLQKLSARADVNRILLGHDYDGVGYLAEGKEAVQGALSYSASRLRKYHDFILAHQTLPLPEIALKLIDAEGCGRPEKLFMALYTVREHLKYAGRGERPE